ncbi:MAG TPA: TetR/AcrR family transcriptional regulator [Solirubrobacteraceae bacterium]|jgi:AcrR family transcriptional regulator
MRGARGGRGTAAASLRTGGARDGGHGARRQRLAGSILHLQRARVLAAAVGLLAQEGYGGASVASICAQAGISRRTYYEVFENREDCLLAILTDAEYRVRQALAELDLEDALWIERVRAGVWVILSLFEEDPALGRVCLVESQRAGGPVQEQRERIFAGLAAIVDEGRLQGARAAAVGTLTAEALVGACTTVLASRLPGPNAAGAGGGRGGRRAETPACADLRDLLGELMGMIVLPYMGAAAARRELARVLPDAAVSETGSQANGRDPLAGLPVRLTYRTARVLQATAELGEGQLGASNRQIAECAGVHDPGQMSKLLARLEHHGLVANNIRHAATRGEPNNWTLTKSGRRLVHGLRTAPDDRLEGRK